MKKTTKILISGTFLFILVVFYTVSLQSYPGGYAGATKKTSATGCHCHTNNTAITGAITGPDTVLTGTTATYTITITRSGYSGSHGGVDIATRLGSLTPGPGASYLKILNGEITHISPLTFAGGTVSVQFSYTSPTTPGIDTIWSTVVAGYSNGFNWATEKSIIVTGVTGIQNNGNAAKFTLSQNYPNPFNPSTNISFELPENTFVSLVIYDVNGKKVDELINGEMSQGTHDVKWNASNMASGVYFYTLKANDVVMTKTMIMTK